MADKRNVDEIAKKIAAEYLAEKKAKSETEAAALEALREKKIQMRNKMIVWAMAGLVMTATLFSLGVAWYTRVSNIHAVTFDVADYELAVNDNTDNEFLVNVYSYANVTEKKAAPGTSGYIPLRMSARHSGIDVDYEIIWENMMLEDLKTHIRFFYLVDTDGKPVVCNLTKDVERLDVLGSISNDELNAKFMFTPNSPPTGTSKKYLTGNPADAVNKITGTVEMSSEKVIFIYWEWYLDADAAKTTGAITGELTDADKTAWDALDTDIGRYPAKYDEAMTVRIKCTGVQSVPVLGTKKP